MEEKLTPDAAVGLTVNQHLFAKRLNATNLSAILGVSRSSATRKLRGKVGWAVTELLLLATYFGVTVDDLMPKPDGMGGWIPAPYVPAYTKNPTPNGVGSSEVVAGTGFEPATSGL